MSNQELDSLQVESVSPPETTTKIEAEEYSYTFDNALKRIGFGKYQLFLMQICGAGWMFDGIEIILIAFILPHLQREWALSTLQTGFLGSSVFLGMMCGAWIGGVVSDYFGRKIVFLSSIFIATLFGISSAFSPSYEWYIALRLIAGIGLGASAPIDFALFMEFVPSKNRGTIMILLNVYWSIGSSLACILAYVLIPDPNVHNSYDWRLFVFIAATPGILFFTLRFFIPESPRYLMISGKVEKAKEILHTMAKWNGVTPPRGRLIFKETEHTGSHKSITNSFLLLSPSLFCTSILLFIIWFSLSFGGWGIQLILPMAFQQIGSKTIYFNTLFVLAIGGCGYLMCALVGDMVGRRTLLAITFLFTGIFTLLVSLSENSYWVLANAIIAQFFVAFPWALVYLYTPEVYPTILRATGLGVCSFFTRMAGTITPIIGQYMLRHSFYVPFLVYGGTYLFAAFCSCLLPVETRGRDLSDEIEKVTKKLKKEDEWMTRPLMNDHELEEVKQ
jgi:putative MFS transporter